MVVSQNYRNRKRGYWLEFISRLVAIETTNKYLLSKKTVGCPRVFDAAAILGHLGNYASHASIMAASSLHWQ